MVMKIYIDEAGRGPLAWPVYVGLVVDQWSKVSTLYSKKQSLLWDIFGDSKKITPKRREELFFQLENSAIVWSYGSSSAAYIDRYGIVKSLQQAICKALWKLSGQKWILKVAILSQWMHTNNVFLVLDGNHDFGLSTLLGVQVQTIIQWDATIKQIWAASIIAKVLRDREMIRLDTKYPKYGFAKHMGYGTLAHRQAIVQFGLSAIHRKSFCQSLVAIVP